MAIDTEKTRRSEDGRALDALGGYDVSDVEVNSFSSAEELPARDRVERFLRQMGAGDNIIETVRRRAADVDVRQVVARFKRFAQDNPAIVLGALSAVILGGAVAAERAVRGPKSITRIASKKSSGSSKKASSSKSSASAARKASGSSKKSSSKSASAKKSSSSGSKSRSASSGSRRATSKRTMIEPHAGDKRYVRRDAAGHFKTEVNVGRSLAADRRSKSKTAVKKGQGDRGDVRR